MPHTSRCTSTARMIADSHTSAADGHLEWAPAKSLWVGGMVAAALVLGPVYVTPGAVILFAATTVVTLCAGHSVGPVGMVYLHDMRDWAQRQSACHDLHANRLPMLRDAVLQMHARLLLTDPPRFLVEPRIKDDRVFRWLEASWRLEVAPISWTVCGLGSYVLASAVCMLAS